MMAAIPKKVSDRFAAEVVGFQKILRAAKDRDINESDTVMIVTDMLASVLGYDKYSDITSEQAIRGTFCDLAARLDGAVKFLIEVKAIGMALKDHHLRQAVNYAANEGIQWAVLTNGIEWQIHRIRFERPIASDLVCAYNFLDLTARRAEDQERLFLLCKEGLNKAAIEEFHEHVQNVNRFTLAALTLSDPVLDVLRRELKRIAPDIRVERDEIDRLLREEVLKREVVEGDQAEEAKARVRKASGRLLRARAVGEKDSEEIATAKSPEIGSADELRPDSGL
jgi:hypothetical protein